MVVERYVRIFLVVMSFSCIYFCGNEVFGQNSAAQAEGQSGLKSNSEMPPALQSMKGKPGYDEAFRNWENSQKNTPASNAAAAQRDVEVLKANPPKAASGNIGNHSDATTAPYYHYKGIEDPAKAKQAWYKDHPALNTGANPK